MHLDDYSSSRCRHLSLSSCYEKDLNTRKPVLEKDVTIVTSLRSFNWNVSVHYVVKRAAVTQRHYSMWKSDIIMNGSCGSYIHNALRYVVT